MTEQEHDPQSAMNRAIRAAARRGEAKPADGRALSMSERIRAVAGRPTSAQTTDDQEDEQT